MRSIQNFQRWAALALAVSNNSQRSTLVSAFGSRQVNMNHFGGNAVVLRKMTSSSSSEEAVSAPGAIVGPELPPIPPMSKRLFLVRHGEVINPGGDRPVFYGAMDVPLSPLGEDEAKAAGQYLKQFDLDLIVSSPLSRAIFGAEKVKEQQLNKNKDIVILGGFKELDRGSWCGLTKDEIGEENMARFDACDESITPDGGESYNFLKKRVIEARDEVLQQTTAGKAAAIVSHLQVTRSIVSEAKDIPTNQMVNIPIATASVTCIDYDMVTGTETVQFESFKPDVGLQQSVDGAN